MYIHRELEDLISPFLKRKEIIIITGPRQIRKTTLLEHLNSQLKYETKP